MRTSLAILLMVSASLLSCESLIGTSPTTSGDPTISETASADTTKPVVVVDPFTREKLLNMAVNSTCANTSFTSQGKPITKTAGYIKGVALTYAKTVCNPTGDTYKVASQPVKDKTVDAFAVYGFNPTTAEARLNTAFALSIGSAARESSWRWFCGKDANASNTTSSTAESGLHQSSYNSKYNKDGETINKARADLYAFFKADKSRCFAKEYKDIKPVPDAANLKNWGTGEGVIFQELSKQCPGFAVEYHLMGMRERVTHYGPLKNKHAELKPACTNMFEEIRQAILKDKNICKLI